MEEEVKDISKEAKNKEKEAKKQAKMAEKAAKKAIKADKKKNKKKFDGMYLIKFITAVVVIFLMIASTAGTLIYYLIANAS